MILFNKNLRETFYFKFALISIWNTNSANFWSKSNAKPVIWTHEDEGLTETYLVYKEFQDTLIHKHLLFKVSSYIFFTENNVLIFI